MSIKDSIKSQYYAALEMLQQALVQCPDALWGDQAYKNAFWHVSYHALWYTHLYLQPSVEGFVPWAKDRGGHRFPDQMSGGQPYRRDEILEYLAFCRQQVEEHVATVDLDAPSGFPWLPFSKLELQIYSIRHLQQHVGELSERLGARGDVEVGWVSLKPE
jgi:hypothetical protein